MLGFPFLIVYGILWFGFWLMRHFFGVHVSDDVAIAILAGSAIYYVNLIAGLRRKVERLEDRQRKSELNSRRTVPGWAWNEQEGI
jgi:hypothetical protein